MKKSLSLLIAIVMAFSVFATAAFAAEAETSTTEATSEVTATETTTPETTTPAAELSALDKFNELKEAGIFDGMGDSKDPALDQDMTRGQFAKVIAKLLGLEVDDSATSDFKDVIATNHWAGPYIAAVSTATPVLMNGVGQGNFDPEGKVTIQMLATVLVRALGLPIDSSAVVDGAHDWAWPYVDAAVKAGIIPAAKDYTVEATREQLVEASYKAHEEVVIQEQIKSATAKVIDANTVEVTFSNGDKVTKTLETALVPNVKTKITVTYKGHDFDLEVTYVVTSVDLTSAQSLNSKVVEAQLNTATTAVDGSAFKATDADGKEIAVASAEIAPWSADGKSVLVTLGADTKAGDLYKLTSGDKTVNFTGRDVDTTAPTAVDIRSTDYNEAVLVFDEPVLIKDLVVKINESLNSSKALEVKKVTYKSSTEILISTADQSEPVLYNANVTGATDTAGNVVSSTDLQFAGIAKNTDELTVDVASATDFKHVVVKFNTKVDVSTLDAAKFAVTEGYDENVKLAVESVRAATSDDKLDGTALGDDYTSAAVITLKDGLKDAVLYKVIAKDLKTAYGKGTASDGNSALFDGVGQVEYLGIDSAETASNTKITLEFNSPVDTALGAIAGNYKVYETYNSNTALTVNSATVSGKTVTLTVSKMNDAYYTVKASNLKDTYGAKLGDANSANFVGELVEDKISEVTSAELDSDSTTLTVRFDAKVGASASDVGHYKIDNGIGYPFSAKASDADKNAVVLTIPKTTPGKLYTITVTGLENADGVSMASGGVSGKFSGNGIVVDDASLKGAVARDSQTIALYFDKAAADVPVWDADDKEVTWGIIVKTSAGDIDLDGATAWVDPANTNILIVRVDSALFAKTNATDGKTFDVSIKNSSTVANFPLKGAKDAIQKVKMVGNNNSPLEVVITKVVAVNNSTVRVYFNQPISVAHFNATIYENSNGTGTDINLLNNSAIDSTNTIYDFSLDTELEGSSKSYYLIADVAHNGNLDASEIVGLKDEASGKQVKRFSGNKTAPADISSVGVVMKDARTIVVQYPEKMWTGVNHSNGVDNIGNYTVIGSKDNVETDLSTGMITKAVWDGATNSVTLTFNADLTASAKDYSKYYVEIDQAVTNAIGNKNVKKGDADVKQAFAYYTKAADKVTVGSATYQGNNTVEVALSQGVLETFGAPATTVNAGYIKANIDVTVNGTDKLAGTKFSVANVKTEVGQDGKTYVTKFDVVIDGSVTLDTKKVGKVAIANDAFIGVNGMGSLKGGSAPFAQR